MKGFALAAYAAMTPLSAPPRAAGTTRAGGAGTSIHTDDQTASRATKVTLISVFLGTLLAFSTRVLRRSNDFQLQPMDLILLGLSTYRAGHMIAYERIAEPIREPFTETTDDMSGAGQTVVAAGSGPRRSLGELLSCPICIGTWSAAGLVYGRHLAPRPTRVLLAILGATGIAEIVYALVEALSWTGRAARASAHPLAPQPEEGSDTAVHASH